MDLRQPVKGGTIISEPLQEALDFFDRPSRQFGSGSPLSDGPKLGAKLKVPALHTAQLGG